MVAVLLTCVIEDASLVSNTGKIEDMCDALERRRLEEQAELAAQIKILQDLQGKSRPEKMVVKQASQKSLRSEG